MQPWIDFLPQEYRQHRRRLRQRWQQASLVAGMLLAAAASVLWQQWRWHRLQDQLQQARNHLALCRQQAHVLHEHKRRLNQARAQAALCSFLQQPWSRSRVLGYLLDGLPAQVRLKQVGLFYQQHDDAAERGPRPAAAAVRPDSPASSQTSTSSPAAEDLDLLQQEQRHRRLLMVVEGTAGNYGQVQQLLSRLQVLPALERVQLLEVETEAGNRLAFRIQGHFRPAFPSPQQASQAPAAAGRTGTPLRRHAPR